MLMRINLLPERRIAGYTNYGVPYYEGNAVDIGSGIVLVVTTPDIADAQYHDDEPLELEPLPNTPEMFPDPYHLDSDPNL